ncbi:RES family NAD+ phosphorylase [Pseudotabrizicola sediminis]|nr:RES family NAD+ phosphorylase [Pseudotabrizicola sediminis]
MADFSGPRDFLNFRSEASQRSRYLRSASGEAFLRAVADTCKIRLKSISSGAEFWRAQVGHDWTSDADGRRISGPHSETRMRPWQDRAYEGRVNAKGIPCLYLATTREVAMSEVRPWIGSILSVARFSLARDVTVVDCSKYHGLDAPEVGFSDSDEVSEQVWSHIDYAFSRPVTRSDNTAEYAATQIIAEVFRSEGYDGVIYKSAFATTGYNIALFDLNAALQTESYLFQVSKATFDFRELTLD